MSEQIHLRIQVHAKKPGWINYEDNRYRIYVNDNLIVERTWVWPKSTFIEENMWINIPMYIDHFIRLETVLRPKNSLAIFGFMNPYVHHGKSEINWINEQLITFKVI